MPRTVSPKETEGVDTVIIFVCVLTWAVIAAAIAFVVAMKYDDPDAIFALCALAIIWPAWLLIALFCSPVIVLVVIVALYHRWCDSKMMD